MIYVIIFLILLIWCIYRNYTVYSFIQEQEKLIGSINTKRLMNCKSYEDLIECIKLNVELEDIIDNIDHSKLFFSFKILYLKNILSEKDLNRYYELINV